MAKSSTNGQRSRSRQVSFDEIGLTGLNFGPDGYVQEEFLPNLQGKNAIEAYKEMQSNDPMVGSVLFGIDTLVRSVDWSVDGDDETPEEDIQLIEECKEDMSHSWPDFISEVMTMVPYGWSFVEICYKMRRGPQPEMSDIPSSRFSDGKIGWRKFAPRSQDSLTRWDFDEQGGIRAYVQQAPNVIEEKTIPITKGLLFRTTSIKNSPEGRSVLRNAYRPWYYKKRIEEIEAIGIERDLAGLPIAYVPPEILTSTATADQKELKRQIENIVRNVKRDRQEGIVWPLMLDDKGNQTTRFELLSAGGTRQFNTNEVIIRYDQRIAMTVLADFILLGHDKVGSFALSSDKTDLFAVALGSFLDQIDSVLNRYAIPRLLALNGRSLDHPPRFKHGDIEDQPLTDVANYLTALVNSGMPLFPDEKLEAHLRDLGGLPERVEGEDGDQPQPRIQPVLPQPQPDSRQVLGLPPRPASLPPRQVRTRPSRRPRRTDVPQDSLPS